MIIINKRELRSSLNIVASCLTYTYVHEFGLRIKIQSKESNFFFDNGAAKGPERQRHTQGSSK